MALTKNDLQQIQNLLTTQLSAQDQRLHLNLRDALTQQSQDITRDIRDEMDARFLASENKMEARMDVRFHAIEGIFRHELQAVIDILLTFVPERFEALERDVVRLKTHVKLA